MNTRNTKNNLNSTCFKNRDYKNIGISKKEIIMTNKVIQIKNHSKIRTLNKKKKLKKRKNKQKIRNRMIDYVFNDLYC